MAITEQRYVRMIDPRGGGAEYRNRSQYNQLAQIIAVLAIIASNCKWRTYLRMSNLRYDDIGPDML